METPYRSPAPRGNKHKVINIKYASNSGWKEHLELKLDQLSAEGWRPILYSDSGGAATVILERPNDV